MNHDPSRLAGDRRARRIDRSFAQLPHVSRGVLHPAANESLAASVHQQGLHQPHLITVGRIVWSMPLAHWYRVQLDVGHSELACCALGETGLQPLSVKNTSPLPPMSRVLVLKLPGARYGIILGVLPRIMSAGSALLPDWLTQGGGTGLHFEDYYRQFPDLLARAGDLADFSSNRPLDATCVGEWGRINDLGGGIFIDPFQQWFRIDEGCGLELHYLDRLARLAAHNYDFRSSVSETAIRSDNGEAHHFTGWTPYLWEALGLLDWAAISVQENDSADVFAKNVAKVEPALSDQQPFYRLEEHRGYLGQLYLRQAQIPRPARLQDSVAYHSSELQAGLGVFREQLSLDGSWSVASAHSLQLAKRVLIPIPKQQKSPEDPTGDEAQTVNGKYLFAGVFYTGPEHQVQAEPAREEEDAPWRAAAVLDLAAYQHNWKTLHPFYYHAKDFALPDTADALSALQAPLDFTALRDQQWLPLPEPKTLTIDHRYAAKFYEMMSLLSLLPDGSVVLRGGGGCELRLAGGTLALNAPGDILLQSGRHVIQYAGDDAIVKARNSIDVTASNGDLRLKGEHHVDVLAGNAGTGRLLLECRASGTTNNVINRQGEDVEQSGLILAAPNSDIATLAGQNLYLRTGSGQIALDAAAGQNGIRTTSNFVAHYVSTSVSVVAGSSPVVHVFGQFSQIQSSLVVGGQLLTQGGIQAHGGITAVDGSPGKSNPGDIGYPQNLEIHQNVDSDFRKLATQMQRDYRDYVAGVWYAAGGIGREDVITNTQFAPRTEAQLNARGFELLETHWQQLAQDQLPVWHEPPIYYQGLAMMPHPGYENWTTRNALLKANLVLHDVATGRDAPLGERYTGDPVAALKAQTLARSYRIVGDTP